MTIHVAQRGDRLVGAAPLAIVPRFGVRRLQFLGGEHAALADVLLAAGEPDPVLKALGAAMRASRHDAVDVSGLPVDSRFATALDARGLRLIPRSEAPVFDMADGWEAVYSASCPRVTAAPTGGASDASPRRGGSRCRSPVRQPELEPALDDMVRLHRLRWRGRPDGSLLATEAGERFLRAGMLALADDDVARILLLRLDGTGIAFQAYFALEGNMVLFRTGFDPEHAAHAPGHLAQRRAFAAGSEEGLRRVEFMGGNEAYKRELADRNEPLHQAIGAPRTLRGRAFVQGRLAVIGARRRLRRNEKLRSLYLNGLAPVRRALGR